MIDPGTRRDLLIRARGGAACRAGARGPGHRGGLDRLGAGHRRAPRGDRGPAEWRRRAAGPGPEPRRRKLGVRSVSEREPAGAGHPQYGLKRLLEKIGLPREEVRARSETAGDGRRARSFRIRMRCDRRARPSAGVSGCLSGRRPLQRRWRASGIVEAANEREEALAIAVLLRETAETPGGLPRSSRRIVVWRAGWRSS